MTKYEPKVRYCGIAEEKGIIANLKRKGAKNIAAFDRENMRVAPWNTRVIYYDMPVKKSKASSEEK